MKGWPVWRGCGSLVFFLTLFAWRVALAAADYVWKEPLPEAARTNVIAIGMLLGAALVLALDIGIRHIEQPRGLFGRLFGRRRELAPQHEFLLVPVAVWPYLLAGAGILTLFCY